MANEKNLIPFNHRTESELREITKKGGKKSGETRRRKKSMKQVMDLLLLLPANNTEDLNLLYEFGINFAALDENQLQDINNMLVVNAALLKEAKSGNVKAIQELRRIIQDDAYINHRIKLEKEELKLKREKLFPTVEDKEKYCGIPANVVAPSFAAVLYDIEDGLHSEYIFPGGRGSTKSSFVGLNVIDLLEKNDQMHACILRQVGNTLKDSVYSQIQWAISVLGLDAEFLKETNPTAYENEYLGVANGTGGNVFDNVTVRTITDEEIEKFDMIYNGVDWGWFPDLYAFVRVAYVPSQHTLYIWQEFTANKMSNRKTADKLFELGITGNDLITCDNAENKSVGDYKSYGLLAREAKKGPGSREYSYKWLQSLKEIVIDNVRCPVACREFLEKEYERDREGNVITGYPDGDDHTIDAVRYATERLWRKKGV